MKVTTLRLVDRWLGTALATALTGYRKATSRFRPEPFERVGRILFVKLAEQGSTVLAHSAIRSACRQVGPENVYFLVFEENRFILDAMQLIPRENVVTIRTGSLSDALRGSLAAVRRLRELRIDAAIDLEFFARSSAILCFLSGARWRVGFHSHAGEGPYRGDLMTHRLLYNPHLHTAQIFQMMVDALGAPAEAFPAFDHVAPPTSTAVPEPLDFPEAEVEAVRAIVRDETGQDDVPPLVLLNANCSDLLPLRRWSNENYVALAKRLLHTYPELFVAFTGGPDERGPTEELVRQVGSDRCVSLAGRTTLSQLLALYSIAEILITNDSGPAHFASLTKIHEIVLFGPETPELFSALSPRSHVVWARTVCSPCVSAYNNRLSRCTDNVCMQRITVDEVFETARRIHEGEKVLQPAPRPAAPAAQRAEELA